VRHTQATRRVLEPHIDATLSVCDGVNPRLDPTFCHLAEVSRHLASNLPVDTSVYVLRVGTQHTALIFLIPVLFWLTETALRTDSLDQLDAPV